MLNKIKSHHKILFRVSSFSLYTDVFKGVFQLIIQINFQREKCSKNKNKEQKKGLS